MSDLKIPLRKMHRHPSMPGYGHTVRRTQSVGNAQRWHIRMELFDAHNVSHKLMACIVRDFPFPTILLEQTETQRERERWMSRSMGSARNVTRERAFCNPIQSNKARTHKFFYSLFSDRFSLPVLNCILHPSRNRFNMNYALVCSIMINFSTNLHMKMSIRNAN